MSLYWNDECWYFQKISKKNPKDASFVLARKLFVSNISEPLNQSDKLVKHFKRYGEIEEIEVFKGIFEMIDTDNANESNSRHCAYVTFKESKSAYLALKDPHQKRKYSSIKIIPADSWRQPIDDTLEKEESDPDPTIMILNDDCLLEIFKYLDLDTLIILSKTYLRFHQLIKVHIYPRFKSFVFKFIRDEKYKSCRLPKRDEINVKSSSLADMYNKLSAVGKYLENIKLIFNEDECRPPVNLNRIIDIFTTHAGGNLRSLTILGISLTERMQRQLQPIFQRLEYFDWHSYYYKLDYKCDLINYCKNLKTLKILVNMDLDVNVNHWQKLENVVLGFQQYFDTDDYIMFFKNNPDIKSLRLFTFYLHNVLTNVSCYLRKLEKLSINESWHEGVPEHLLNVLRMPRLKTLKFSDVYPVNLNGLVIFLGRFTQLDYLKIIVNPIEFEGNRMFFVDPPLIEYNNFVLLAKAARSLRKMSLRRCKLHQKTISDFVRYAKKLEVFDLRACEIEVQKELIENIIAILQNSKNRSTFTLICDQQIDEEIRTLLQQLETKQILVVEVRSPNPYRRVLNGSIAIVE